MGNYWILKAEMDNLASELYGILFVGNYFSSEKDILKKFEENKQWIYDQHPQLSGCNFKIDFVIDQPTKGRYIVTHVIIR